MSDPRPEAGFVFLPLAVDTKRPTARGWPDPEYKGVNPATYAGQLGLRCDRLVVVDCDTKEAMEAWVAAHGEATLVRKTQNGWHLIYEWTPGCPTTQMIGLFPDTDIKAGPGSQIVIRADGYETINDLPIAPADPAWFQTQERAEPEGPGSEVVGEGERNNFLTTTGGGFRRSGLSAEAIAQALLAVNQTYCDPPLPDEDVLAVARSVSRYEPVDSSPIPIVGVTPEQPATTRPVDEVWRKLEDGPPPPPEEWHVPNLWPKHRMVMLDGLEGIGKGLLTCKVAEHITSTAGPALWIPTEDDADMDITPRLRAAGYSPDTHHPIYFPQFGQRFLFPTHAEEIMGHIDQLGVKLVVLDPGRSLIDLGKDGTFNDESVVRPALESLNQIAAQMQVCILFVHHWNKDTSQKVGQRQTGSAAFSQVPRHRLSMAQTDAGVNAFGVSKSNIGSKGHIHLYTIQYSDEWHRPYLVMGPAWHDSKMLLDSWLKKHPDPDKQGHDLLGLRDKVLALAPGTPVSAVGMPVGNDILGVLQVQGKVTVNGDGEWERC